MMRRSGGFSLIELIVALTVSVVVVGFIATFITVPVRAHVAQARRGELTASAETLTRAMAEDVRTALPGSPRAYIDNGRVVLELIPVLGVVRYCDIVGADCPDRLDFAVADSQFDVVEDSRNVAASFVVVTDNDPTDAVSAQDAYGLANIDRGCAGHSLAISSHSWRRPFSSSTARRTIARSSSPTCTRYECDPDARTLRRSKRRTASWRGASAPGAPSDVIARDVTACRFTFVPAPAPPSSRRTAAWWWWRSRSHA